MKRAILLSIVTAIVLPVGCLAGGKALFIEHPAPDAAKLRQSRGMKGSGVFLLHIDSATGTVKSVDVEKSTGTPLLDEIAVETLQKWRARPGTNPIVHIPWSFTGRSR